MGFGKIISVKKSSAVSNTTFPAAPGPGVYSASNRNEYQKHRNNYVSGE
jgi:hypothetical protein